MHTLLSEVIELTAKVELQLARSEQRMNKVAEICETLASAIKTISDENGDLRREYVAHLDKLTTDRNQLRDEYKKLVKDYQEVMERDNRDREKWQDIIRLLVSQPKTTINNG